MIETLNFNNSKVHTFVSKSQHDQLGQQSMSN